MSDARRRSLDRAAAAGDASASLSLAHERKRAGLELLPELRSLDVDRVTIPQGHVFILERPWVLALESLYADRVEDLIHVYAVTSAIFRWRGATPAARSAGGLLRRGQTLEVGLLDVRNEGDGVLAFLLPRSARLLWPERLPPPKPFETLTIRAEVWNVNDSSSGSSAPSPGATDRPPSS